MENDTKTKTLTPQQELFCILYTTADTHTFSNATISYAEAYKYDLDGAPKENKKDLQGNDIPNTSEYAILYRTCQSCGSRLLTYEHIKARINSLLLEYFNSDDILDARLSKIALAGRDADAINAIKHRNDIKQRITKKLDITTLGRPLAGLTDEELQALAGN